MTHSTVQLSMSDYDRVLLGQRGIGEIVALVAATWLVPASAIRSRRKDFQTAQARHVAIWLIRRTTKLTLAVIGQEIARLDHTSATHACKRVERQMRADPDFRAQIEACLAELRGRGVGRRAA